MLSQALSRPTITGIRPNLVANRKPSLVRRQVYNSDDEDAPMTPTSFSRSLDFNESKNAGIGYTDEDSAGQSNIFAQEPKVYVDEGVSINPIILAAGAVAAFVVVFGLGVSKPADDFGDIGSFQSLTELAQGLRAE